MTRCEDCGKTFKQEESETVCDPCAEKIIAEAYRPIYEEMDRIIIEEVGKER